MSLITRCPACGTMFNVVNDQLKVSQGWVRCGRCAAVFDASLHLKKESASPLLEALKPDPKPEHDPERDAPVASLIDASWPDEPTIVSTQEEVVKPQDLPGFNADIKHLTTVSSSLAIRSDDLQNPMNTPDRLRNDIIAPVASDPADGAVDGATDDAASDVSFVRDARRQAFWRRRLVRATLVVMSLLLACILALQLAVYQRDALLALEPRLKPWVQQICDLFVCDLGPAHRIDAIVIDSSSFIKTNDSGSYQLSFSIKNSSPAAVAMPWLEVSLTDTQDQAVIRRVLSPEQFGATNRVVGANADFSSALILQVRPELPPLRVAGYRLLAFYP